MVQVCKFVCYMRGFIKYLIRSFSNRLYFFLEIPFSVVEFGIKTYVSIFKFVAGVNRELIWEIMFCLCNSFFVTFW